MNHSMFQAIDSVAEMGDSDNREHMVVVSRNLHQIRGSLQMVELDAASTFAGDLELLTDRLAEDVDMPDQVSAIRVLRSGLELLRRYLKTIEAQSPQSPLFLMDQMNAVRDITGQRQLSGFDLFDPPLEAVYPHSDETMAFQDSRLENVVSHLRKRYRKSLLEWMNGSSPTQALDAMRDMMMHLRKIAGPGVLQQLWWVAAGFIDAIRAEGIELNPEIYARLAELDVQMGRMRTQRMVDIASTPPNELIRWMLYAVGQARLPGPADSNGASGTTREIKEMFGLDQWFFLDDDSYVVDEFWDLVNAVEALSRIISESDIQYLEEAVDRYFSTDPDEEYKRELFADLEKLRKAVHEHDVGVVRDFVDVLCETIMGIDVDSGVLAQSRADIKVASSILLLGDTLKKPSIISSEWKDSVQQRIEELNRLQQQDFSVEDSAGENQQARLELVNATTALVREARRHLNGVEELLLAGPANESMDAGDLSGVRDLLQKTARLLWFVNAPGTGELVNRTDTILARHLESGQDVSGTMREELIFLVASIEIVVETIGEGNPEPREILEQARARLDALESADVLPEQDEKDDPEPADEKGDIAPDGAAVDGEPSSEDQATDQASDPAGKAMGSPEQHAKEILELVDPVADAPDEFLSGKGTGEVAPENETAADAVDQGLEQRLFSVPEQIDSLRRSIDAGSDDKATIEALSALFSSLMTDQSPEFRNEIRQVAAIGHSVTTGLIRRQVGYNNEINDFLGLLTRQMTSLIAGREDVEVQLSAWVSRAAALLDEAAPASRADDMEPEVLSDGPDHDLMETFSRELEQHATGLEQAAEKFLLGIDGPGEGGEDLDTECERISRIVHTLAGNFNALGFSEYGNCICELEEIFLESRGKADLMQEYVPYLRQFSALIRMMSDRIGTGHQVPPGFDADLTGISDLITAAYGEAATAVDTGETLPDDDMSPSLVDEDHGGADTVHVQPAPGGLPEQPDILEENAISGEADSDSADAENVAVQVLQDDDFDQELKEVFREESEMILSRINGLLTRWKSEGLNREILSGILREFHTLKGSAAATGFDEISGLSHAIESLLERAVDHGADTGDASTLGLLEEMHDGIASDLGIIPGGEAGRIVSLQGALDDWLSRPDPLPATDEAVSDEIAEKPAHPEAGGVVPDTGPVPENVAATDPEPVSGSAVELAEAAVLPEDSDQTADDMAAEPETGQASPASALGEDVPGPGIEEEISPQESQDDDFDQEMKEVFREESEMILGRINEWLTGWKADGFSQEVLAGILREFHTLKGSAAATGFDEISGLSHAMESLLDGEIVHGSDFGDEAILNLLEEMHDGIASELGFIPGGEAGHIVALKGVVDTLLSREPDVRMPGDSVSAEKEGGVADEAISEDMPEIAGDARQPACDTVDSTPDAMPDPVPQEPEQERQASSGLADTAVDRAGLPPVDEPGMPEAEQPFPRQWTPADEEAFGADFGAGTTGYMRIESRKLADLLNFSGEMGLTRTQLRSTIGNARKELIRMRGSMEKIREGLRDLEFEADAQMRSMPERHQPDTDDEEFDPLQLDRYSRLQARAREVSRYLDELGRVERQLEERAAEISGALVQQSHVGEQLHEQLLDARLVNVGEYFPRFRTLIREFSRRMGKRVAFEVSGGDVNVDRQVMDLMIAPFEHMIRNAISHGVELPDRRRELGKTETGSITMSVVQQGSELVIGFGDDGSGLDREKLRQQAVRSGLTDPDTPMTDDMMLRVIAEPGFSTAEEVTMGAGRGVGMDVVVEVVRTLGGGLSVTSEPGKGTTFHFRLPVTMTVSQALLVRVGSYRFAVLTRTLERVMRVRSGDFEMIEDRLHVRFGDQMAPVIDLVDLIGEMSLSTEEEFRSIILARVGERVAAIQVDLFEETIDIVSKTPGRQLTSIPGISGVTVLADTTIVLILNLGELVQREATIELTERQIRPDIQADREEPADDGGLPDVGIPDASAPSEDAGSIERVLVVDDSIVVRRVMCRDLEAIGMTPIAAVDGLDALDQLERHEVDFLLIDLEMPRMNGYELLINLKQDERFARLPVVVITSRSSDTHRERAVRLGADGYVTKPYDIRQLEQLMLSIATARHAMH